VQVIRLAFDLGDLFRQAADLGRVRADRAQQPDRLLHHPSGRHDPIRHLAHLRLELRYLEKQDSLGGLLHLVDGIVHRRDQVLDGAPVEWCDEGASNRKDDVARDRVRLVLSIHNGLKVLPQSRPAVQRGAETFGSSDHQCRMLLEEPEKAILSGHQGPEPC